MRQPLEAASRAAVPFLPSFAIMLVLLALTQAQGAYDRGAWYPLAIGAAALLAVEVLSRRRWLPQSRAARFALGLLGAFVAWSFLSVLWADSPGPALEAAHQLLLYLVAAWVLALAPWTARSLPTLLALWVAGSLVIALVSVLGAASAGDPARYLIESRFSHPFGYANAAAALGAMAGVSALAMSARRSAPVALRAALLAGAVFLIEYSLLPQSRGVMVAFPLAVLVVLILSPDRFRLLAMLAVAALALMLAIEPVLDVYGLTRRSSDVAGGLDRAVAAIGPSIAVAFAGGLIIALLDRRIEVSANVMRRANHAFLAVGLALVLAGIGAGIVSASRISGAVSDRWAEFTSPVPLRTSDGFRLLKKGSDQRADYWRVSIELLEEAPVGGAGAGSFEHEYAARRQRKKHSRYAHGIWFRTLAEGGLAGTGLLLGFVVVLVGGSLAAWWRAPRAGRQAVAATLPVTLVFLVVASIDWVEAFPTLAVPGLAAPLLALAVVGPSARARRLRPALRRAAGGAGLVALVVTLVSLVPAYLSSRYVDRAYGRWSAAPQAAFADLQRARDLNPLSAAPDIARGSIAVELDRPAEAVSAFRRGLERERSWYPHFELALLAAEAGSFGAAEVELMLAGRLNSGDPLLRVARREVRARRRIDPRAFNARIFGETLARYGEMR